MARDDQNLDPLLDTMANVVGILVVLVAVTQLSVADAVERISGQTVEVPDVTPEQLEAAQAERDELILAVGSKETELAAYAPTANREGLLLDELRAHVESLEGLEARHLLERDTADELAERVEQARAEVARLDAEVQSVENKLSGLDALLDDVPAEPRPKIARLPNPRSPPRGATQLPIFCRYGQLASLDLAGLQNMLRAGIRDALGDNRAVTWTDRPWLVNLFRKQRLGSGNFYWSFREEEDARAFFADLKWVDQSYGDTLEDLRRGDSSFEGTLAEYSPRTHFLRFFVWPDCFETYLEARYIAELSGWNVGWEPVDADQEVGMNLTGGRSRVRLD